MNRTCSEGAGKVWVAVRRKVGMAEVGGYLAGENGCLDCCLVTGTLCRFVLLWPE